MKFKSFVLLALALLLALPAAAQEQRASLEGVIRDAQGGVLPGVTVEAKNLATGAAVDTVTGDAGTFRFPALAPGLYEVTASLSGFQAVRYERVELLLGQIKRLEGTLQVAGVTEQVQVTAESPLVDVKQSQRATSIRDEQIDLLPKGRDFTTLVTQAAGANQESKLGGISIDGASAGENRFIIDGIETTIPLFKRLIVERAPANVLRRDALKHGMRPIREDGWLKIKRGITTLSEVLRVTMEEEFNVSE